jgi:hypothetical protein
MERSGTFDGLWFGCGPATPSWGGECPFRTDWTHLRVGISPTCAFCATRTASSPKISGTNSFDSVRCWTLEDGQDGQMRGSLVVCLLPLYGLHGNSSWRETEFGTKLRLGGQSSALAKCWVDTCTAGILSIYLPLTTEQVLVSGCFELFNLALSLTLSAFHPVSRGAPDITNFRS